MPVLLFGGINWQWIEPSKEISSYSGPVSHWHVLHSEIVAVCLYRRAAQRCSVTTRPCGSTCTLMDLVYMCVPSVAKLSWRAPSSSDISSCTLAKSHSRYCIGWLSCPKTVSGGQGVEQALTLSVLSDLTFLGASKHSFVLCLLKMCFC